MSNSQLKTGFDGYKLCEGGPCEFGYKGVSKRASFILNNLGCNTKRVLDIGCGVGVYFEPLSKVASKIVGIDINENYLKESKQNAYGAALMVMSAEELAFKENSFDAVILIETLEHIPNDRNTLKEISRVLKPNGKLIITAPNKWFPFETHGIRVGAKLYGFPLSMSMPFLPYLPSRIRRFLTPARVYSRYNLSKLLIMNKFLMKKADFLTPSLDVPERKARFTPKAYVLLRGLFECLERTFLNRFVGSTVIICAEKLQW